MSAGESLPGGERNPPAPRSPGPRPRILTGPRRRRFYGTGRVARVPELAALLPAQESGFGFFFRVSGAARRG